MAAVRAGWTEGARERGSEAGRAEVGLSIYRRPRSSCAPAAPTDTAYPRPTPPFSHARRARRPRRRRRRRQELHHLGPHQVRRLPAPSLAAHAHCAQQGNCSALPRSHADPLPSSLGRVFSRHAPPPPPPPPRLAPLSPRREAFVRLAPRTVLPEVTIPPSVTPGHDVTTVIVDTSRAFPPP